MTKRCSIGSGHADELHVPTHLRGAAPGRQPRPDLLPQVPAASGVSSRSVDRWTWASAATQSLVNAYDNTILYTITSAETIRILQAVPKSASTMIYMSDHGESLGEHGFYLHGAPQCRLRPRSSARCRFSCGCRRIQCIQGGSAKDMLAKAPFGDDNIFHSVLGAFGGSSSVYKPHLDLFSHAK